MSSRRSTRSLLAALFVLVSLPIRGWAGPAPAGVPNFHQVNDRIYRGGQPDDSSWPGIAGLGVRTVIDLRRPEEHSTVAESTAVAAAGMRYLNFPMNGFDTPTCEGVAKVLAALDGDDPVFIHCRQGRDRTGSVIAAYRISRERWPNDLAMNEALACGLHWYENGMKRFISSCRLEALTPDTTATAARDTTSASSPTSPAVTDSQH